MRVQKVEELELDKITIIANVRLSDKRVQTVKVNGVKATEKMVNLSEAQHLFYRQRMYKKDIGVVGAKFETTNVILAYDEEHLNSLLSFIQNEHESHLNKQIQSLEETLAEFKDVEWNNQNN